MQIPEGSLDRRAEQWTSRVASTFNAVVSSGHPRIEPSRLRRGAGVLSRSCRDHRSDVMHCRSIRGLATHLPSSSGSGYCPAVTLPIQRHTARFPRSPHSHHRLPLISIALHHVCSLHIDVGHDSSRHAGCRSWKRSVLQPRGMVNFSSVTPAYAVYGAQQYLRVLSHQSHSLDLRVAARSCDSP